MWPLEALWHRFKFSWWSLYKLCIPGIEQFIQFFLTDPHQIGWKASRLKSGFWLGHSRTVRLVLKPLVWCDVVAVGLFSCWKVSHRHSPKSCALWSGFLLYLAPFILPSFLTSHGGLQRVPWTSWLVFLSWHAVWTVGLYKHRDVPL